MTQINTTIVGTIAVIIIGQKANGLKDLQDTAHVIGVM